MPPSKGIKGIRAEIASVFNDFFEEFLGFEGLLLTRSERFINWSLGSPFG